MSKTVNQHSEETPDHARQRPRSVDDIDELAEASLERRQQVQAMLDTSARTFGGIFAYLALWLIISLFTGLPTGHPALFWRFSTCLVFIAVLRLLLNRRFPDLVAKRPRLARQALIWTVLANGLSWGLMTAASVYYPDLETIRFAMTMVAIGIGSAGSMAMAIDPILKVWFPLALIIPITIGAILNTNNDNLVLASLIVVFTIYVMLYTRMAHRDYWRAMQANAALERASLTDALTQVANRMSFDRQYACEWRRASRRSNGLAILMVDLDHFKHINDTYGHPAGDTVLQHVAGMLQSALLRGGDSVARYGGEEFVVLLPQTDLEGANAVVRRILANVAAGAVQIDGREAHVTCSVGYAWTHPRENKRPEDLLKLADAALYAAKAAGRNQAYYVSGEGVTEPIKL